MNRLPGLLMAGAILMAVSGCAYIQPDTEIETDPMPIKEGPGIFTGRSGEWTIIRGK